MEETMAQQTKTTKQGKSELFITRVFDAPRELVWKAWTEPERMMRWWGPKIYTCPVFKIDLRIGGKYLGAMKAPDGKLYWSTGVYREIAVPERLVMTDSFADEKGNIVPGSYYGMSPDWPTELLVAVTFKEQDGKTVMDLRHSGLAGLPGEEIAAMEQGWKEQFDKLVDYLAEIQEGEAKKMNSVIHFEIPATDLNRAKKFYKEMFGWGIMDIPGMEAEYAVVHTAPVDKQNMLKEPGTINGGLAKRSEKDEATVIVIDVPSIDDYLKKLTAAGSKIIRPKQNVLGMGLYARVTDSEGNVIGIWETIKK
jgi:uncharacterized protein YndB with AHSA1/START domain/predicted enzyme related to lactoylglutathione lyase